MSRPPLWRLFGHWRHYLLTGYVIGGMLSAISWFAIMMAALLDARAPLSPAALAFFAGFALLIMLVVTGVFVATVALEDLTIAETDRVAALVQRDRVEDGINMET